MMIKRHISKIAFSRDFGRQMRFIIGPRQTGNCKGIPQKTELPEALL